MAGLRLIAGLGNPGPAYRETRHNVGFMVLDCLAKQHDLRFVPARAWKCEWTRWGEILLVKPGTYMNESGAAVGPVSQYHKIDPGETLVVVDDVALPLGRLRLRSSGSAGGHNGLRSLIEHLGSSFMRLRIGIGAALGGQEMLDHVLGRFSAAEHEQLQAVLARSTAAIEEVAANGLVAAMNLYNRPELT